MNAASQKEKNSKFKARLQAQLTKLDLATREEQARRKRTKIADELKVGLIRSQGGDQHSQGIRQNLFDEGPTVHFLWCNLLSVSPQVMLMNTLAFSNHR